ncbi:MAG TPA: DHA2 family efflux MFS transporter permease subunit, partial [Lacisediminihabitans sp.]|uniref:DHA2 family efflux MFS transporter permease subunit n=1 Tax=Lacisediminihabitans sp. TaxID=2787631 RepID=UPI002ED78767
MTTSASTANPATAPVSQRRLTLISLVLVLGAITTLLDTTIVNIALDHLHTAFHASVTDTQWVVTGYLLAYVAVIPVSGWASERFGTRRVWMFAVAAFMIGSLLCGVSWSLPALIAFRVLQGIGGGMVLPVTITILTRAAGRDRIGRAIATIGFIGQLAPILGPLIGGTIIDSVGWHWLFFVNIPICLVALVLAPLFLPVGQKDGSHRLDVLGFVLLTPGVIALAYGISQAAGAGGFAAPDVWIPLALGVVLVAAFVLHALRATRPALLDVRVFARRSFGLSSVVTFVGGFSLYALMLLLPLFYQQVRGDSVFATGLLLIPQGLGTMCFILVNRR